MLTIVFPATGVLADGFLRRRRRGKLPFFIILLLAIASRRGRSTLRYTLRKLSAPIRFLLWCVGPKRMRNDTGNMLMSERRLGKARWVGGPGAAEVDRARGATGEGMSWDGVTLQLAGLGDIGRLTAFDKLRELQQEGACCDVTLAVGGQHFKAHKCILAAQSFPLRAMFDGAFKEGSERVVALRDVEPSTFALLLDFLYDRSIKIDAENVEAMLELSARYGVSLLRRHCCAFIARSANPSNACDLLAVADRFDCHRLRKELLAYVLKHFPVLWCEVSAGGLRHLPFTLLAEVLRDDRLVTGEEGEIVVFRVAVSWLEVEISRERDSDQVLSHVRFGLISAKTLASEVEVHPLLQTKASRCFVHEAYRYQALPLEDREKFAASMEARARPRVLDARHLTRKPPRWVRNSGSLGWKPRDQSSDETESISDDDDGAEGANSMGCSRASGDRASPCDCSVVGNDARVEKCLDASSAKSCSESDGNVLGSVEECSVEKETRSVAGETGGGGGSSNSCSRGRLGSGADESSSLAQQPCGAGLRMYV